MAACKGGKESRGALGGVRGRKLLLVIVRLIIFVAVLTYKNDGGGI